MMAQETHWKLLKKAIELTAPKPILELGAGDCSTRQIDALVGDRRILTVDTDSKWLEQYKDLEDNKHNFVLLTKREIGTFPSGIATVWGVSFVDLLTWEMRLSAVNALRFASDYILIHDAERGINEGHVKDYSDYFKWWIEFGDTILNYPSTLIGSNTIDLTDFTVEGMYIISRNK